MLNLLSGFVEELRRGGLPVSLTEHLDAAEAVHYIPIEDREALKYALGATLVKSSSHWHAFETTFDIYFARGLGSGSDGMGDITSSDHDGDQPPTPIHTMLLLQVVRVSTLQDPEGISIEQRVTINPDIK